MVNQLKSKTGYLNPKGVPIKEEESIKDLGLWQCNDFSKEKHINETVKKASRMSGLILRTFYSRDSYAMKTLYKALVLSQLEYCSPLIHPTTSVKQTMELEKVQRHFTRHIDGMREKSYWTRLQELNMYSVERRRERFVIIHMFRILHNLAPNPGIKFKQEGRNGILAEIPTIKTNVPYYIRKIRYELFTYIAPRLYNILPPELSAFHPPNDGTNIVHSFKTQLDKFLARIPDQPTVYGEARAASSNSILDQILYKTS